MPQSYVARWVFPIDRPPIPWGRLTVEAGRIVAVEPAKAPRPDDVDLGHAAILPGLVNAHVHLDLGELRGKIPPTPDFTHWLRQVVHYRRSSSPAAWSEAIATGIVEVFASGATLVADVTPGGASMGALRNAGLRSMALLEVLGLKRERWGPGMIEAEARAQGAGVSPSSRVGWAPHAPYSVARGLLEACIQAARPRRDPIAMHFAETPAEATLLDSHAGPLRRFLDDIQAWEPGELHGSLAEVARRLANHQPVLYVHANCLFEMPDHAVVLDQLARRTASVVYCPRTHAYFGHPPHPFLKLLQAGYAVALGTDSLASNPDLSVWNEMRFLWRRHCHELSGADLLRMGTLNGAQALGWGGEVGSLTPGKHADFVTVALARNADDPHEAVFEGDGVAGVWVGGVQQREKQRAGRAASPLVSFDGDDA